MERLKTRKRHERKGLSCAPVLYLLLYQLYYKSLCGRRQVAEPPKNICIVSVCFGSILALFYHPISLQWTENHHSQGLFAVL
jgi:hypothetical protein